MAGFYHKFIKNYAKIASPMTDQLKAQGQGFTQGEEQCCSFDKIKVALAMAPIIEIVDPHKPFVLEVSTTNRDMGAVPLQDGCKGPPRPPSPI